MKSLVITYFFFLLFLFSFFVSGIFDSHDGLLYLSVARNIYYKGEFTAPEDKYDANNRGTNINLTTYKAKNGKTYSFTGLGYSLALLPAVVITDLVYKNYNIAPPVHFPLENDWLILFLGSFTNAFFGALLGVVLLLFFLDLELTKKQSLFMSFIAVFATNLWVYTKHSMAHMMFVSFLMLAFYLLKKYSRSKNPVFLLLSGIAYGVVSITYNQTFILTIIPLFLYFFLLTKPGLSDIKKVFKNLTFFALGFLPFLSIFMVVQYIRSPVTDYSGYIIAGSGIVRYNGAFLRIPFSLFFEGLYGQLLSPGRSIFIYSPLLLTIIFFWHRIKPRIKPELIVFLVISLIYIIFYASAFSMDNSTLEAKGLWHGESSWGPRYLTPLIPLGMLIAGYIFTKLTKFEKRFFFYPLMIIGIFVNLLGVILPYQLKFHNLEPKFYINDIEYTSGFYSDLLPRHTPILSMSKHLINLIRNFPKTFNRGTYNVKFYDGIEFPFNVGPERWREIEGKGYIAFANNRNNPVKDLTFGLINHPISESSESAGLQFTLNGVSLLQKPVNLKITERQQIKISVKENLLKPENNDLSVAVNYDKQEVAALHKQILGFISFDINGQRQNMESLDIPYVSPLGPKMTGVAYKTWGGSNKDPWRLWNLHSQIFERLPDFWWIRNLYHWDIPKYLIPGLFGVNIFGLAFFGKKLFNIIRKKQ